MSCQHDHGAVQPVYPGFIDCQGCGWVHQHPLPDREPTLGFYHKEYFEKVKPETFRADAEEKAWIIEEYADLVETMSREGDGNLYDHGCGPGWGLEYMSHNGWRAVGYDPSIHFHQRSLSARYRAAKAPFPREGFDVAVCLEVLEHCVDPLEELRGLYRCLRPGGVLVVKVPNEFNPLQHAAEKLIGEPWYLVEEHINYWTPDTLGVLIKKAGFYILDWRTTFPMEVFLLMGQDYVHRPKLGRPLYRLAKTFERNYPGHRALYRFLRQRHIGRDLIVWARRPLEETERTDLDEYADEAWGPHRTAMEQAERLGEEFVELVAAIAQGNDSATRYQVADCGTLLADIARMTGTELDHLIDWKTIQKKKARER